jgi:glycerol-3-phosphate acyltransferase PlsY
VRCVKGFVQYTAARLGLFLACYALVWLVVGWFIRWNSLDALSTALVALIMSSVLSLFVLKSLRARFAAQVASRADRAVAAFEAKRRAEDVEDSEPGRS